MVAANKRTHYFHHWKEYTFRKNFTTYLSGEYPTQRARVAQTRMGQQAGAEPFRPPLPFLWWSGGFVPAGEDTSPPLGCLQASILPCLQATATTRRVAGSIVKRFYVKWWMTACDGMLVRSHYLWDLRQISFNLSSSNKMFIVDSFLLSLPWHQGFCCLITLFTARRRRRGLPIIFMVPKGGFILVDVCPDRKLLGVVQFGILPKTVSHSLKAGRARFPSETPFFKSHKTKDYTIRKVFRLAEQASKLASFSDFPVNLSTPNSAGSLRSWASRFPYSSITTPGAL